MQQEALLFEEILECLNDVIYGVIIIYNMIPFGNRMIEIYISFRGSHIRISMLCVFWVVIGLVSFVTIIETFHVKF